MIIYNGFSQTPTRNHTAAGIDFFVPNVLDDSDKAPIMKEAIKKSFNITDEDITNFEMILSKLLQGADYQNNVLNIAHLYYALKSKALYDMKQSVGENAAIILFIKDYLVFDVNGKPGVVCKFSDMLKINSGIKVALEPSTCLEYMNKSGKGTKGWSVKACLVDEDYSGYCHLSMQYLWWDAKDGTVFVGDKITQGVVYRKETDDAVEVTEEKYNEIMANSQRGADGFGSSDVKH